MIQRLGIYILEDVETLHINQMSAYLSNKFVYDIKFST